MFESKLSIKFQILETGGKQPSDIFNEIKQRAQSVSFMHPMRIVNLNVEDETTWLGRSRAPSEQSYHQYMAITA